MVPTTSKKRQQHGSNNLKKKTTAWQLAEAYPVAGDIRIVRRDILVVLLATNYGATVAFDKTYRVA